MTKYTLTPMRSELVGCLKSDCGASDPIGIHSQIERRYICHTCHRTVAETTGTMLYGLKHPIWVVARFPDSRKMGEAISIVVSNPMIQDLGKELIRVLVIITLGVGAGGYYNARQQVVAAVPTSTIVGSV